MKVDNNTLRQRDEEKDGYMTERAKFARICVEVDLQKVLVPTFELYGRVYKVEYEGIQMICSHCGRYGHRQDTCDVKAAAEQGRQMSETGNRGTWDNGVQQGALLNQGESAVAEAFGPWMIVDRRACGTKGGDAKQGNTSRVTNRDTGKHSNHGGGSRFSILK